MEAEALQPVSRDMVAALKLGEEHKQKSYVATCRLSASPDPERLAALNASTDILVSALSAMTPHTALWGCCRHCFAVLVLIGASVVYEVGRRVRVRVRAIRLHQGVSTFVARPAHLISTSCGDACCHPYTWQGRFACLAPQVEQQTPTRVSQRRADLVRKRLVHSISCEMIEVCAGDMHALAWQVAVHFAQIQVIDGSPCDQPGLNWAEITLTSPCDSSSSHRLLLSVALRAQGSEQHDCVLKLRTQAGTYIKVCLPELPQSLVSEAACPSMPCAQRTDLVHRLTCSLSLRMCKCPKSLSLHCRSLYTPTTGVLYPAWAPC